MPDLFAWIMKSKNEQYQKIEYISKKISNKFKILKNTYDKEVNSSNV